MDPPGRSYRKGKPDLAPQSTNSATLSKFTGDGSPSPFAADPESMLSSIRHRRPRSSQTVSIEWADGQDTASQQTSKLHIEVTDCVETKTVTTTTTTKRTYPPLLVRQRALSSLDSKEYPLASKNTPHELSTFSFDLDGRTVGFEAEEQQNLVGTCPLQWKPIG